MGAGREADRAERVAGRRGEERPDGPALGFVPVDDEHAAPDERDAERGQLLPHERRDPVEVGHAPHRGDLGADPVDGRLACGLARLRLGLLEVEVAGVGKVERAGQPLHDPDRVLGERPVGKRVEHPGRGGHGVDVLARAVGWRGGGVGPAGVGLGEAAVVGPAVGALEDVGEPLLLAPRVVERGVERVALEPGRPAQDRPALGLGPERDPPPVALGHVDPAEVGPDAEPAELAEEGPDDAVEVVAPAHGEGPGADPLERRLDPRGPRLDVGPLDVLVAAVGHAEQGGEPAEHREVALGRGGREDGREPGRRPGPGRDRDEVVRLGPRRPRHDAVGVRRRVVREHGPEVALERRPVERPRPDRLAGPARGVEGGVARARGDVLARPRVARRVDAGGPDGDLAAGVGRPAQPDLEDGEAEVPERVEHGGRHAQRLVAVLEAQGLRPDALERGLDAGAVAGRLQLGGPLGDEPLELLVPRLERVEGDLNRRVLGHRRGRGGSLGAPGPVRRAPPGSSRPCSATSPASWLATCSPTASRSPSPASTGPAGPGSGGPRPRARSRSSSTAPSSTTRTAARPSSTTGSGARHPRTGRQIGAQTLTRGNLALAVSARRQLPVRVSRGAGRGVWDPPAEGYRYDGLYTVADYWESVGQDGYRIWRFRLAAVPGESPALP